MNILELFAGSRSIGKEAEKKGLNVFSVDWTPYENINLVIDIEKLKIEDVPFIPNLIWASPDCTTYSLAAIYKHRNGTEPQTEYAKKSDRVNINLHNLIKQWLTINPNLKYYIENPRGMMGKMQFVKNAQVATVWYCKYGDYRAKPTNIFSNNIRSLFNPNGWQPRPQCYNGNTKCHHEAAPRGSQTGTQGKKESYERSKIPEQLCKEIIESSLIDFKH